MDYNTYDLDMNDYETLQELVHPELMYMDQTPEGVDTEEYEDYMYEMYVEETEETKELVTY